GGQLRNGHSGESRLLLNECSRVHQVDPALDSPQPGRIEVRMRRIGLLVVLAVSMFLAPVAGQAQPAAKGPRVGGLSPGSPPPRDAFHQRERFEAGLRELGWKPGSNIAIEYRYAEGKLERLPAFASELSRIPVDVIIARGLTIAAARQATTTIPIVMAA